jgi:uncharacterized membrane protein (DUF485 family)
VTQTPRELLDSDDFRRLVARRWRLSLILTAALFVVYYGFILLVAFRKDLLATPIGGGVMTWGIPIGFGVILFTIAITAYYVRRANGEFDDLSEKIKREALK